MQPRDVQLVHGLRVASEVPIAGAAPAPEGAADIEIELDGAAPVPDEPPPGELVASLDVPGARYEVALGAEKVTIRLHEVAEFEIDLGTGRGRARPAPGREALLPVLLAGNVLSVVLGLRGVGVLHASTFELDGAVLMVAGASGAGKSTLAALACAQGAALIGDDTARIGESNGRALVHRGACELRLRPQAAGLADRVDGSSAQTPDGRVALQPRSAQAPVSALTGLLFPIWGDDDTDAEAHRLRPREAMEMLLACSRVAGWTAREPLAANLDAFTLLAESIPAFRLALPRGHLDDEEFPRAMSEVLETAGALAGSRNDV